MKQIRNIRIVDSVKTTLSVVAILLTAMATGFIPQTAMAANSSNAVDAVLLQTGMSAEQVSSLDELTKQFIVDDLQSQNVSEPFRYIDVSEERDVPSTRATDVFTAVAFSVTAFRSGNQVSIYPTYEFTDYRQPRGQDSFSMVLGNSVSTYEFGGKVWYQDPWSSTWKDGETNLQTNRQELNAAEFSGNQLGDSTGPLKYRGNVYIHATATGQSDKRICLNYLYNPNGMSYSLSFSAGSVGISISVPFGTAYSKGQTLQMNF